MKITHNHNVPKEMNRSNNALFLICSVLEIGGIGLIVTGLALAVIPSWVFVRRTWLKNPEYFQVRSEPLNFIFFC